MQIQSNSESLSILFSGQKQIVVPEFQRNYAWGSDQIDSFLKDIFDATLSGGSHFFGPVVLLRESDTKFALIDGQQRITTAVTFICLIRDLVNDFDNSLLQIGLGTVDLKSQVDMLLFSTDLTTERFVPNYQIRAVFKSHIIAHPLSPNRKTLTPNGAKLSQKQKLATKELRTAYSRLNRELKKWILETAGDDVDAQKELIYKLLNTVTSGMELLTITVFSQDDAYVLFETLNDRGLRLTAADLLKSFTLRGIERSGSESDFDAALSMWDESVANIGAYPFTKFLRHYLLAEQNEKVQSKRIFKIFDQLIKTYGENGSAINLEKLHDAALCYSQLLNEKHTTGKDELDIILKNLNLFSETHRVFLLKVFMLNFEIDEKLRAAKVIEALAFRWVLTGGNAQELETIYQTMSQKLGHVSNTDRLDEALTFALEKFPADDKVRSEIANSEAKSELQFYVLRKVNKFLAQTELVWDKQQLNIEHLAPQKPAKDSNWFENIAPEESGNDDVPNYADFVGRWGNLTLLEFEINKSVQNGIWNPVKLYGKEDKPGLKKSQVKMTKDVCKLSESWTSELISSRSVWMAIACVEFSSKSTLAGGKPNIHSFVQE